MQGAESYLPQSTLKFTQVYECVSRCCFDSELSDGQINVTWRVSSLNLKSALVLVRLLRTLRKKTEMLSYLACEREMNCVHLIFKQHSLKVHK